LPQSVADKIVRAKEHYDVFAVELRRQFHGHTGKVVMDVQLATDANIRIDAQIPNRTPLILGDCLQNLRSSLDYLVWELVLAAKGVPTETNAFPVADSRKVFKNNLERGYLTGLTDDMIAEVEFLQPYHAGDARESHPLWLLNRLTNINKHRRILLIQLRAAWVGKMIGSDKYTVAPSAMAEMYEDVQPTAFVTFDEGEITKEAEACSLASQLISEVERIIPNFNRFFG